MENDLDADDFEIIDQDPGAQGPFLVHQGWLQKKSNREFLATWQNRFFALTSDGQLNYYNDEFAEHRGTISVHEITELRWSHDDETGDIFVFTIVLPHRSYTLCAEKQEDFIFWIKALAAIRRGLIRSPSDLPVVQNTQILQVYRFSDEPAPPTDRDVVGSGTQDTEQTTTPSEGDSSLPSRNAPLPESLHPEERSNGSFAQMNMQRVVFVRWVQWKLGDKASFTDLKQLANGQFLPLLAEALTGHAPPETVSQPQGAKAILDNISRSLQAIAAAFSAPVPSLPLPLLGTSVKVQMDLVWHLIHMAHVRSIRHLGMSGQPALLAWLQERLSLYSGISITNFTSDWTNGLALAALIHSQHPSLLDWSSMAAFKALDNVRLCLRLAEEHWAIPPLPDPVDVTSDPDECAMITYLALFYHRFNSYE